MYAREHNLQITENKSQQPPSQKSLFKGVPKGFLGSHSVPAGLYHRTVCVMPLLKFKKNPVSQSLYGYTKLNSFNGPTIAFRE